MVSTWSYKDHYTMYAVAKIFLLAYSLYLTSADLTIDEYDERRIIEVKQWHTTCRDVTGITEEELASLKAGHFTDDVNMKKYLLCMWRSAGIMDENLDLVPYRLMYCLPRRLEIKEELDMVEGCLNEGKQAGGEQYEQIFVMQQCLYKKDSVNVLMF
nr:pheromone-binding protein-related protein 6-like isoform X2 [Leptinotarsa decemlineata]